MTPRNSRPPSPLCAIPHHEWRKIPSGLEDVFIGLMDQAKDNFA